VNADVHIHVHIHTEPDGLAARVDALEAQTMTVAEDLNALNLQVAEFVEDVDARVAALEAAQGNFTVEGQAAFDALKAIVAGGVVAVGDADGDGNPPATP
jgi:hypothetical protein